VYVLNDGGECDLDLGNYERYLDVSLGKDNNVTTGKVYQHVIEKEVSQEGHSPEGEANRSAKGRLFGQNCSNRSSPDKRCSGLD
jgi:hypothetical protein